MKGLRLAAPGLWFQMASKSPVVGTRLIDTGAAVPANGVDTGSVQVSPPSSERLLYWPPRPVRISIMTRPSFSSTHAGSQHPSPGFTRCDSRQVSPSSSEK